MWSEKNLRKFITDLFDAIEEVQLLSVKWESIFWPHFGVLGEIYFRECARVDAKKGWLATTWKSEVILSSSSLRDGSIFTASFSVEQLKIDAPSILIRWLEVKKLQQPYVIVLWLWETEECLCEKFARFIESAAAVWIIRKCKNFSRAAKEEKFCWTSVRRKTA